MPFDNDCTNVSTSVCVSLRLPNAYGILIWSNPLIVTFNSSCAFDTDVLTSKLVPWKLAFVHSSFESVW